MRRMRAYRDDLRGLLLTSGLDGNDRLTRQPHEAVPADFEGGFSDILPGFCAEIQTVIAVAFRGRWRQRLVVRRWRVGRLGKDEPNGECPLNPRMTRIGF